MVQQTQLEGNSKISNQVFETGTDVIKGFDVVNPNGSKVHVDLSQYVSKSHPWYTSESTPELRREVYNAYEALVENVPAVTPLFENIAENFPQGISHEKSDQLGAFNNSPGKNNENHSSPLDTPIVIIGNISLPKMNGVEQPASYYMGEDKQWHRTSSAEVLLHELGHSSSKLQNWTPAGIALYNQDLGNGTAPKDEKRTMQFLSTVLRVPIGKVAEDLESYSLKRPDNVSLIAVPTPPVNLEGLRHGPIPKQFEEYSHPRAVPVINESAIDTNSVGKGDSQSLQNVTLTAKDKLAAVAAHINTLPERQRPPLQAALADKANKIGLAVEDTRSSSQQQTQELPRG
jgi:hypothetical protein